MAEKASKSMLNVSSLETRKKEMFRRRLKMMSLRR
jgi:hypothetical protein